MSDDQIREQWKLAYEIYKGNFGALSFEDWLSEGMPEDDYDYDGCSGTLGDIAIPQCRPGNGRWSDQRSQGDSV